MAGRNSCSQEHRRSSRVQPRRPRPTPSLARPSCMSRSDGSRWSSSGSKKKSPPSAEDRRSLVEANHPELSVRRQCALLGLNRSTFYYEPAGETPEDLRLMRRIDELYTACPFYGSRKITEALTRQGEEVNRKRIQRLMRVMGLEAIYPKPRLSVAGRGHKIYPYLLRGVTIARPDQVWSADITYVPLASGFMYLAAVIDWCSRYVIAWRLSNTLDGSFCLDMLDEALSRGRPDVFNTDQGVQFTAQAWTGRGSSVLRCKARTFSASPLLRLARFTVGMPTWSGHPLWASSTAGGQPWLPLPSTSICRPASPSRVTNATATATALKSPGPWPRVVAVTAAGTKTPLALSLPTGSRSSVIWISAGSRASGSISRPTTAAPGAITGSG